MGLCETLVLALKMCWMHVNSSKLLHEAPLNNLFQQAAVSGGGSWAVQSWADRRGWPGHLWCPLWRSPSWLSLSSPPGSPASHSPCQESSFPLRVRRNNKHAPPEVNVNHQPGLHPLEDVMRLQRCHVFGPANAEQMLDNRGVPLGVIVTELFTAYNSAVCFNQIPSSVTGKRFQLRALTLAHPSSCCVSAKSQTSAGGATTRQNCPESVLS